MIVTVDDTSDVVATAAGPIRHRCPHRNEVDRGNVTVTWRVEGQTIELHSLRDYLNGYREAALSHEQVTDRIAHDLAALPGLTVINVGSVWNTAGMEVTCSTSPTPAETP